MALDSKLANYHRLTAAPRPVGRSAGHMVAVLHVASSWAIFPFASNMFQDLLTPNRIQRGHAIEGYDLMLRHFGAPFFEIMSVKC